MLKSDTKKRISWLILLLFLIAVQWLWGWGYILQPWKQLDALSVFFAACLFLLSYQIRTWRLYDYFHTELNGQWLLSLRLILLHNVFNTLLPLRSGEIGFPVLMKRYFSVAYSSSFPALFWFRLLDLHTILAIGLFPILLVNFSTSIAVFIFALFLSIPLLTSLLTNQIQKKPASKRAWGQLLEKVMDGLPQNRAMFWKSWLLTWLNWLMKLAALAWILGQLLEINIDFVDQLSAVIASELSSVLPFHAPGGVGTYEIGITAVLSRLTTMDQASQVAINVHLFVLGSALFGGIIGWLIPKKRLTIQQNVV